MNNKNAKIIELENNIELTKQNNSALKRGNL